MQSATAQRLEAPPAGRQNDGSAIGFRLNGAELLADRAGVLVWPDEATLVVADLHFEKGSGLARNGALLPPYDTAATLDRLDAAIAAWAPKRVICLGDSFHDGHAAGRLEDEVAARIRSMTAAREWVWITGNHDPAPPTFLGGTAREDLRLGPLVFRHEAVPSAGGGEVSGHFHPKARVAVRGGSRSGRCFVTDGRRLILPAFGAYTGGLDVLDPAIDSLLAAKRVVFLLGKSRIHGFPARHLRPIW